MIAALALSLISALPAQEPETPTPKSTPAVIGAKVTSIRAFHHETMPEVAKFDPGTPVRIVAERQPWARVQVPGGLVLWVYGKYVDRDGSQGVLNSDHVRARPLPSTGPESYPVGQFAKGDAVRILDQDGDWFQVVAPESLGGWVPLSALVVAEAAAADWDKQWRTTAAARLKTITRSPAEAAAAPAAVEEVPAVAPAAPAAAEAEVPAAAPQPEPSAAMPDAELTPTAEMLGKAEGELAQLAAGPWEVAAADRIEAVMGAVLWSSDDVVLVDRARVGLARLETLRAAAALEEKVEAHKRDLARDAVAAEAAAARTAAEPEEEPAPADRFTVVGWLEYRPRVYSAVPYAVVSAGKAQPILAKLGRYELKEFVGREVAVQGTYRPSTVQGLKVLEIDRLRILPSRPQSEQ